MIAMWADTAAKQATSDQILKILQLLFKDDFKREARNIVTSTSWRKEWHLLRNNNLRELKPTMDRWTDPLNLTRKQNAILTLLRIESTWHTHKHLMEKTERETCTTCVNEVLIKHIWLACHWFDEEKRTKNVQHSKSPNVSTTGLQTSKT